MGGSHFWSSKLGWRRALPPRPAMAWATQASGAVQEFFLRASRVFLRSGEAPGRHGIRVTPLRATGLRRGPPLRATGCAPARRHAAGGACWAVCLPSVGYSTTSEQAGLHLVAATFTSVALRTHLPHAVELAVGARSAPGLAAIDSGTAMELGERYLGGTGRRRWPNGSRWSGALRMSPAGPWRARAIDLPSCAEPPRPRLHRTHPRTGPHMCSALCYVSMSVVPVGGAAPDLRITPRPRRASSACAVDLKKDPRRHATPSAFVARSSCSPGAR